MLKKYLFLSIVIFMFSPHVFSQITGAEFEVVQVHYGDYGDGKDLTGYVTYRLYVTVENENDYLLAIYGLLLEDEQPDTSDIFFNFDCNLFQHEFGSDLAGGINCAILDFPGFESLAYDSWFTVGEDCDNPSFSGVTALATSPTAWGPIAATFEGDVDGDYFDGGDVYIDDGVIFLQPFDIVGYAGTDLRVLVGQFTTCGTIDACFSAQVYLNADPGNPDDENLCASTSNPCVNQPLSPDVSILDGINCYGETATVNIGEEDAGNGGLFYKLHNLDGDLIDSLSSPVFSNLVHDIDYYVAVEDELGCRDTSEVFSFEMPDSLVFSATLNQDVLCFNDTTASICYSAEGGSDDFSIDVDGVFIEYPLCAENLTCGEHTISLHDTFGCTVSEILNIECPDEPLISVMAEDILCFGECNGQLVGSVDGGTGGLHTVCTVISSSEVLFDEVLNPGSDVSFVDLCPGNYTIEIVDSNNCSVLSALTIDEPDALEIIVDQLFEDSGLGDGSISISIIGGVGEYSLEWSGPNAFSSQNEDIENLVAGDYFLVVTDENDCTRSEVFMLNVGVGEFEDESNFQLVPNPNVGLFSIQIRGIESGDFYYSVIDIHGRIILEKEGELLMNEFSEWIDISRESDGVYFLKLSSGEFSTTVKFVKQK